MSASAGMEMVMSFPRTVLGLFSKNKGEKKLLFYDSVCIKTNKIQAKLYSFFILILKEIRTFLWAPKSTLS